MSRNTGITAHQVVHVAGAEEGRTILVQRAAGRSAFARLKATRPKAWRSWSEKPEPSSPSPTP